MRCHAPRVPRNAPYVMECAQCHGRTEVQLNQHARQPSGNSKPAASGASGLLGGFFSGVKSGVKAVKDKVSKLGGTVATFNCSNCNTLLHNPNVGE